MNAVVTLCIGSKFDRIAKATHPTIKNYADKIGADFIVIDKCIFPEAPTPHWEKFQIYNLLKKYNRIIFLDTDLIIRDDTPDLFSLVPEIKLGIFDEGRFSNRVESIREAVMFYKEELPKWENTYYNTGVMIISRVHRSLFKPPAYMAPMGMYEQPYLNLRIIKDNIKVYDIQHYYNRMTLMDRLTGEDRLASYIVHYAGAPNLGMMEETMVKDLEQWKKDAPDYEYKQKIVVSVGGGLGDQVDAEPVVRHIREISYPRAEIAVQTHWPRIFQHMKYDNFSVTSEVISSKGESMYWMYTMPDTRSEMWQYMSHPLCHTIDFASMSTARTILSTEEKAIHLDVTGDDNKEVDEVIDKPEEYILVHPGKGWPSKSFPSAWWYKVICGLLQNEKKVALIGKYVSDEQGYQELCCPSNAIDLRNMLTQGGLFALLSRARVLVSNDSAPVHIAGAFDNYIVLIPTCKAPHHILPWRKGSQEYKTMVLYKKLICDCIESVPTKVYGETIDWIPGGDILQYLPNVEDVVDSVCKLV